MKKQFERQKLKLKKKIAWQENNEWRRTTAAYELDKSSLIVHSKMIKMPNISSHTLVDLCGLNRYASVGKTVLSMFGFLEKQDIPLYQAIKGGIAEEFASQFLDEIYGGRYDIESFTLEQFAGYNQFPQSKPFSGALDKLIHGDIKLPVEIKSKEMKDYQKIAIEKKYPKDQVVQGANQAYMFGADKFMMLYVFLKPEISEYLQAITKSFPVEKTKEDENGNIITYTEQETLWSWGKDYEQAVKDLGIKYEHFVFHYEIMDYDKRIIQAYRERAQKIYNAFLTTRTLPRHMFKKEEIDDFREFVI